MDPVHGAPTRPPSPANPPSSGAARGALLAPEAHPVLRVTAGPGAGQELALSGGRTSIGRARDCTLCIADLSMSRHHAVIEKTSDGWYLRDLGSGNGTFLNGVPTRTAFLAAGDVLAFGDTRVVVAARPPEPGARAERAAAPAWAPEPPPVDHELPELSAPTSPGSRRRPALVPAPRGSTLRLFSPYLVGAGIAAGLAIAGVALLAGGGGSAASKRQEAEKRVEEGLLHMTRGEWENARVAFQVARGLDPENAIAARNLERAELELSCARAAQGMDAHLREGRLDDARAVLAALPPTCSPTKSFAAAAARLSDAVRAAPQVE